MSEFSEELFDVGSWKTIERFEDESCVFCYAWSTNLHTYNVYAWI